MGGERGFGMFWSRHDTIYLISHLPKGSVLNSYDSASLAVIFFHYNSSLFTLSVATDPPSIITSLKPCVPPPPVIYVDWSLSKKNQYNIKFLIQSVAGLKDVLNPFSL